MFWKQYDDYDKFLKEYKQNLNDVAESFYDNPIDKNAFNSFKNAKLELENYDYAFTSFQSLLTEHIPGYRVFHNTLPNGFLVHVLSGNIKVNKNTLQEFLNEYYDKESNWLKFDSMYICDIDLIDYKENIKQGIFLG